MSETTTSTLEYGECRTCESRYFPIPQLDPCAHDDLELHPFRMEGTVYSWTRSWSSTEDSVLLAMVDFADGTLRVTAPVKDAEEVTIGAAATIVAGDELPYVVALTS